MYGVIGTTLVAQSLQGGYSASIIRRCVLVGIGGVIAMTELIGRFEVIPDGIS